MIHADHVAQKNERKCCALTAPSFASMSTPSLDTLPVEALHRILDHVDTETVFLSFPIVCQYFHAVINSYNQYKIDFRSITKSAFHQVRNFIKPKNVIALTLSNDHRTSGQINLFLSLFRIHSLTRLRSLTLIPINNVDLTVYLKHINKCPLISLSIEKRKHDHSITDVETMRLLVDCPIRHLSITHPTLLEDISDILLYFPRLETFLLDAIIIPDDNQRFAPRAPVISNLKSLVIHFNSSNLNTIISILSHTTSLTHLKLTGSSSASTSAKDGYWWAQFIETNLPLLQSFEFFFHKRIGHGEPICDIKSIIIPFRTLFWLDKRWYVTCDYYKDMCELNLYTTPICKSTFLYRPLTNKISCSNSMNEIPNMMDNISSLVINPFSVTSDTTDRNLLTNHLLFTRVSKLTLVVTNHFSNCSIDYLLSLTVLSHVDTLSLNLDLNEQSLDAVLPVLNRLFDGTCNVQSISLYSTRPAKIVQYLKIIHPTIPNQVRNLTVPSVNEDEVQWILDQLERFSSITFQSKIDIISFTEEIINNFKEKGQDFTCYKNVGYASFWLVKQQLNN